MKRKLSRLVLAMATVAFASALAAPAMAFALGASSGLNAANGDDDSTVYAIPEGTEYATVSNSEELKTALNNKAAVILLKDGKYNWSDTGHNGTAQAVSIYGESKNAILYHTHEGEGNTDYDFDGYTVNFYGLTISGEKNGASYPGWARMSATYNDCVIKQTYGLYAGTHEFNYCTLNVTGDQYNVWTWGAENAAFTRCTFNSDGKAVLLYGQANTNLTLNDCVFNDSGALTSKKAAVEIGNDYGKSYTLTVNNTSVNGYEINDEGINTGTTLWGNKNSMGGDKLKVAVDGNQVYPVVVAAIGENKYESLQAAVEAATDGATITVIADHELTWDGDTVVDGSLAAMVVVAGKAVTIDLNGKTLTVDADKMNGTKLWAVLASDENGSLTLNDSVGTGSVTATGNGYYDASTNTTKTAYCLMMAYEDGTKLTVNGGTYNMASAHDSLVYSGGYNSDLAYVKAGNFNLGNVGAGENGKPWIFNVLGAGDNHANVTGGTFNADINRQHWSNEVVVPETYYTINNGDGTWTVKEGAIAFVNEGMTTGPYYAPKNIGYATFEEAVAAAVARHDSPVTLLKDVTVSGDLDASAISELVQNGKSITLAAGASLKSTNELTVNAVPGYYVATTGDAESGYTYTAQPIPYIPPSDSLPETGCTTSDACLTFPDFDEDAWYHEYMDWAYENGIITGYDSGLMGPEDHTTRAQVVTVLYRLAGSPNATGEGAWYADAMSWALEEGIVKGYNDDPTKLGENDVITRQQIATIMHRFAISMGWDVSVGEDTNILSYPDALDVDEYAIAAMQWTVGMGIIGGYGDTGELAPQAGTERAELAAMLFRLNEAYGVL